MKRGQIALDWMLLFAAFLGILAIAISASSSVAEKMVWSGQKSAAIQTAKSCASIIDAVFANAGGKPSLLIPNCTPKRPHVLNASGFEFEKETFTIADRVTLVQLNGQTVLEVLTPEHYR